MDRTAGSLDALKTRMKQLMPKNEPCQKLAIVLLTILFVVLVILVLS